MQGRKVDLKAAKILQSQFALLRTGCRATSFACREVLDLSPGCTWEEIVQAVHRKMHRLPNVEEGERLPCFLAWVTAARQLIQELKGK